MEESADQRGDHDAAQILPAPRPESHTLSLEGCLKLTPPPAPRDPSECAYRIDIALNLSALLSVENVSLLLLRANDTDAEEEEE